MQGGDAVVLGGGGYADKVLSLRRWWRVGRERCGVEENEVVVVVLLLRWRRRSDVGEVLLVVLDVGCWVHENEGLKAIWSLEVRWIPMKVRSHFLGFRLHKLCNEKRLRQFRFHIHTCFQFKHKQQKKERKKTLTDDTVKCININNYILL